MKEEKCTFSSWGHSKMYTPDTIAYLQTEGSPIKMNKNCCCCQSKNLSGTADTIKHLKTFRVISNEMLVLLLILTLYFAMKDF